ncbi:MAG TPA: hypothetical protein VKQ32_28825, partial [Polyangia bacterium]|nr:hypothetical protein [Polyangia bacterium]
MREDLDRPLAAGHRRIALAPQREAQRFGAPPDLVERRPPQVRVGDVARLDLAVGQLELRLD